MTQKFNMLLILNLMFFVNSCYLCTNSPKKGASYEEFVQQNGKPNEQLELTIYSGKSLYEYQGSLYKLITPKNDTIKLLESVWQCKREKIVIWSNDNKIVDFLIINYSEEY